MIESAALLSALAKKWEDFSIIAILLFTNQVVAQGENKRLTSLCYG
jgi:hypothetical protein